MPDVNANQTMKTKNVKILGSTLFVLALCVAPAWAQLNYNFNDNAVPPGTTASGVARVADNVLHLTDAGQAGVNGVFVFSRSSGGKRGGNLYVPLEKKNRGGGWRWRRRL